MIPVIPVRKPRGFAAVQRQGRAWLSSHPRCRRPKDLWTKYLPILERGFMGLCGYAAMLDPTGGTVDHYRSWKNHPDLAYEWSNYRFASETLNNCKRNADATVLDPYEVGSGWFEVLLPSLQMVVTSTVPRNVRAKAEFTLRRLKLCDGERVIRWRQRWYELYRRGHIDIDGLAQVAPLLAEAVRKSQRGGG